MSDGKCTWQTTRVDLEPEMLLWDGRLHNAMDLEWRVWPPQVRSDESLALGAYRQSGVSGLRRLIGDWSLVIRDPQRGAIVLASDYAGVRPLYYCRRGGTLFWSTRIERVVEMTGCDAIDQRYVGAFLTGECDPHRTIWADVRVVPSGHAVTITSSGESVDAFWVAPVADEIAYKSHDRYVDEFRALFRDAVAVRLQTPGSVIAELSGGWDSSSVVCMAARLIRSGAVSAKDLTTVSYVYAGSKDTPYIHEVRSHADVRGVELSLDQYPLASEEAASVPGEGWTAVYSAVAKCAERLGVRTLLTGQAGDMIAANFFDDSLQVAGRLRRLQFRRGLREALAWSRVLRRPVVDILLKGVYAACQGPSGNGALYQARPATPSETSLTRRFAMASMSAGDATWFGGWMQARPERRRHFLQLANTRRLRALRPLEPVRHLDYTHPFAHRPLVEFLMSVPNDVLCRPGEPRRLMRAALGDLLPDRVRRRRSKALFGAPWLASLRPLAVTLLREPSLLVAEYGWVDQAAVRTRLQRLVQGLECNEPQLRRIVLLECWLRQMKTSSPGILLGMGVGGDYSSPSIEGSYLT